MVDQNIIEFHHASLEFSESRFDNVYDLDLDIKVGEFFGLCGTRHSGAQTFCMMINGLAPHATGGKLRGHVLVKGLDTREAPPKKLALHVGIVFDDPEGQFLGMTVEDHVCFGPENWNLPIPEIHERVSWALKAVGMYEMRNRMLTDLSGGQKQRVAIAAALAMRPDILVLSDVTFALDPVGSNEIYSVAQSLNIDYKMTVIILDQDTEKLCEYCDRIAIMDEGRISSIGSPDVVFQNISAHLKSAIRVPQVTEFYQNLKDAGYDIPPVPVKLKDAIDLWRDMGGGIKLKVHPRKTERTNQDDIIQIKDLTYSYNGIEKALDKVNLNIHKGDFLALIGQNGSGKTTLVRHLIGLLLPSEGKVIINGKDARNETVGYLARSVGYVFQNPDHQLFTTSVRKELAYGPTNLGIEAGEIEKRVVATAEALGLTEHLEIDPYKLSRGERQRVAIGSILTMGPEILVLDEPTTGLFTEESRETLKYIKNLNKNNLLTVIMISHDMRLVSEYCTRAIVLSNGRVIEDNAIEIVFHDATALHQAALYPPQITQFVSNILPEVDWAVLDSKELFVYQQEAINERK